MSSFNGTLISPERRNDSAVSFNDSAHMSVNGVNHSGNGIKTESNHKSSSGQSSAHHKSSNSSNRHHSSSSDGKHHKHHKSSKDKSKEKHSGDNQKHSSSEKHKHSSGGEKHKDKHVSSKEKHTSGEKHKNSDKSKEHRKEEKHSTSVKTPIKDSESKSAVKISGSEHKSKHSVKPSGDAKINSSKLGSDKHGSGQKYSLEHSNNIKKEKKVPKVEEVKVRQEKLDAPKIKEEPSSLSDDDVPLAARNVKEVVKVKRELYESDDEPLSARAEKKQKKTKPEKKRKVSDDEGDDDFSPSVKKKVKRAENEQRKLKKIKPTAPSPTKSLSPTKSPTKRGKKVKEEEVEVWKWWEEEKLGDGVKWRTLSHKGPVFASPYERVPKTVKFLYEGKHMELSDEAEEVAGFYARMLDHEYTTREIFNKNFFKDWKKVMTPEERNKITDLSKCNFRALDEYFKMKTEERKAMTKEQKLEIKKKNEEMLEEYGYCIIDGHKQKIGNFKIEPPGLFRGRGDHPKMGMLKKRIMPENVIINIGRGAEKPDAPPGHKWKEVRHDNTVTWLACWTENILNQNKYIMLNPSSKLKGEKDFKKYEMARKLKSHAGRIRKGYEDDWKNKEMRVRQRAVALYFIDKLALRAGNEKEEGETADTVGCCSLRVEHITLDEHKDGKDNVVTFDFLGKDSIRYVNSVPVEKRVYKNLKIFMENKQPGDDLFDRLNTSILNKYLNDLMDGLTAKVFRTYNASKTLQEQLDAMTKEDMSLPEKLLTYNRANRAVAILCNHQRSVPKTFDKQMENMKIKIDEKEALIKECKKEIKELKNKGDRPTLEKKKRRLEQLNEQLKKLEVTQTDKEENKQIALGTSKLNYLDPRISVAWCKKWEVPIEKIYNKTQRDKFRWAIEMATADYTF